MDGNLRELRRRAATGDLYAKEAVERAHDRSCPPPRETELGRQFQVCKEELRYSVLWAKKFDQWCADENCHHWDVEVRCKGCGELIEIVKAT